MQPVVDPFTILQNATPKECYNVHGVTVSESNYVADNENEPSYWALSEETLVGRYDALKRGDRITETDIRTRNGRVCTDSVFPTRDVSSATMPCMAEEVCLNRLMVMHRRGDTGTVSYPECIGNSIVSLASIGSIRTCDLSSFLIHPHVTVVKSLWKRMTETGATVVDAIMDGSQLNKVIPDIIKTLESCPLRPGEIMSHVMTTPMSKTAQITGVHPHNFMLKMARYVAMYRELEAISSVAPASPLTVSETAVSTFRPLHITVVADLNLPTYISADVPWFHNADQGKRNAVNKQTAVASIPYDRLVLPHLQDIIDEVVSSVTRLLNHELRAVILDNRATVVPICTVLALEPKYSPPVQLLTKMGGTILSAEAARTMSTHMQTNGCLHETTTYFVSMRLVWPSLVAANLQLQNSITPLLTDIVRKHAASSDLHNIRLEVDCKNQCQVYGSSTINGQTGPLLCRRLWISSESSWTADLSKYLNNTMWLAPPFGIFQCVPHERSIFGQILGRAGVANRPETHSIAHMLLTWLCSVQPWGRPVVQLLPRRGETVRGAGMLHTAFPSVKQQQQMMIRENDVVLPMDEPQSRVTSLIDILNGISPRRARQWTEMLDVANLAHMMTYGTAEGMCVFIEWVLMHRKDAAQISEEVLMNIWRFCGTHRVGHDTCSLDTLLMRKQFGDASALATAGGSGNVNGAGTVTQHTTAFNTLYGILRLDNPKRAREFAYRESIRANANSQLTKSGTGAPGNSSKRTAVDQFGLKPTEHTVATWLFIRMRDTVVNCMRDIWIFKLANCHRWVSDKQSFQLRKIALGFLFQEFAKAVEERRQKTSILMEQAQITGESMRRRAAEEVAAGQAPIAQGGRGMGRTHPMGRGRPGRTSAGRCLAQVQSRLQMASGVEDPVIPAEIFAEATELDETEESLSGLGQIVFNKSGICNVVNVLTSFVCDPEFISRLDTASKIPFPNGVLDMHTQQLRDGRPHDFCGRGVWWPYCDHTPNESDVQTYEMIMARMFRYPDVIAQGSLHVGMQLNVGNIEKMHTTLFGETNGGKSNFVRINGCAMGEQQSSLPVSEFTASNRDQDPSSHSTNLMSAQGCKIVITPEPQHGTDKWDGAKIKRMTGMDLLLLRQMYEVARLLLPTWRPWAVCNTLPEIVGMDFAIVNRMWNLPFRSSFTDAAMCAPDTRTQLETGIFPGMVFTSSDQLRLGSVHMAHAFTKYCLHNMNAPSFRPERSRRSVLESMSYISDATNLRSWLSCFLTPRCVLGPIDRVGDRILQQTQIFIEEQSRQWTADNSNSCDTVYDQHGLKSGSPRWRARVSVYMLFSVMWHHSGWLGGIASPHVSHEAAMQQQSAAPDWLHALPCSPHPWLPRAINSWILFQTAGLARLTSNTATHPLDSLCEHLLQQTHTVTNTSIVRISGDRGFNVLPMEEICNKYSHFRRLTLMPGSNCVDGDMPPPLAGGGGAPPPGADAEQRPNQHNSNTSSTIGGFTRHMRDQHYGDGNTQMFNLDPSMFRRTVENSVFRQIVDGTLKSCSVVDFAPTDPNASRREKIVKAVRLSKQAIRLTIDTMTIRYMRQHGVPPLHIQALNNTIMNKMMMTSRTEGALRRMQEENRKRARPEVVPEPGQDAAASWKSAFLKFSVSPIDEEPRVHAGQERSAGPSSSSAAAVSAPDNEIQAWHDANASLVELLTQTEGAVKQTLRVHDDQTDYCNFNTQSPFEFDENAENRKIMYCCIASTWGEAEGNYSRMHMERINEMNRIDERNTISHIPYGFTDIGKIKAMRNSIDTIEPIVHETLTVARKHIQQHQDVAALMNLVGSETVEPPVIQQYRDLLQNQEQLQVHLAATSVTEIRPPDDTASYASKSTHLEHANRHGLTFQNSGHAFRWLGCVTTDGYIGELANDALVAELLGDAPVHMDMMHYSSHHTLGDDSLNGKWSNIDRIVCD